MGRGTAPPLTPTPGRRDPPVWPAGVTQLILLDYLNALAGVPAKNIL